MFASERQTMIDRMVQQNGAVTTASLVEKFGVSVETIRRDLLLMEHKGLISRVHGGAVKKGDMKPILRLEQRNMECEREKRELSLKAMEFIKEGDIIGVDAGSTAIFFVEVLKEHFSRLTVVTYSLDVFEILRGYKEFTVILCGGHYLEEERAFYGGLTIGMLETLQLGKAFIFPAAISLEHGICDYSKDLYQLQKQLILSADEIYLLADSSKFEKKALLRMNEMKEEYRYITDHNLPKELVELYQENQRSVYLGSERK